MSSRKQSRLAPPFEPPRPVTCYKCGTDQYVQEQTVTATRQRTGQVCHFPSYEVGPGVITPESTRLENIHDEKFFVMTSYNTTYTCINGHRYNC